MTFYHLVNFRTTPSELYTYEITSVNLSFPRHGLSHIKPNELGFFFSICEDQWLLYLFYHFS